MNDKTTIWRTAALLLWVTHFTWAVGANGSAAESSVAGTSWRGGPQCADGIDNDGDGLTDWQFDLGCTTLNDDSEGGLQGGTVENGWTVYEPTINKATDDTIIYYVSAEGDDSWSGLLSIPNQEGTDGPKQTILAALSQLRDGSSDWVLLRRGDSWSGQNVNVSISGRSPSDPIVIASYGEALARPRVLGEAHMSGGANVAIMHLSFNEHSSISGGVRDVVVEGCFFDEDRLTVTAPYGGHGWNVRLRRNVFWNTSLFVRGMVDSIIEGNVIHRDRDLGQHGMYLSRTDSDPIVTRGNLVNMQGESMNAIKQRPGGLAEGNVLVDSRSAALYIGECRDNSDQKCLPPVPAQARGNLFLTEHYPGSTGLAFLWENLIPGSTAIQGNIFKETYPLYLLGNAVVENNILFNTKPTVDVVAVTRWHSNTVFTNLPGDVISSHQPGGATPTISAQNNHYFSTEPVDDWIDGFNDWKTLTGETGNADPFTLPNPDATLAGYHTSIGGAASTTAFFDEALMQAKFQYRPEYSAAAVIAYFRDAFSTDVLVFTDGFESGDVAAWSASQP